MLPLPDRDSELEQDFPGLRAVGSYVIRSAIDPVYNCVAYAVGDVHNFWYDVKVKGYYWPPGTPSADTYEGWIKVFMDHGYVETNDSSLEPEFEKVAIYGTAEAPEHVARQKATGAWTSKMGKGHDIDHSSLSVLEHGIAGIRVKLMKRRCRDGKRVLE